MSTPAPDFFSEVGHRVKMARGSLDQAEFARRVGLRVPSLSRLENAKTKPQLETLLRIAEETRRPIDWFLGREDIHGEPESISEALAAVRAARQQLELAEGHLERLLNTQINQEKSKRDPRAEDILGEPVDLEKKRKRRRDK